MDPTHACSDLECVAELPRAAVLLHPLRLKILRAFDAPKSATDVAGELGLARQKVNYHVGRLARARFLRKAGRRQKRGLKDQCFVQSARGLLVLPQVLGPLAPQGGAPRTQSAMSAAYLLALSATIQRELGVAWTEASAAGKTVATLAIDATLRFTSAAQRTAFAAALHDAVAHVVQLHASPYAHDDGSDAPGRPYRLVVAAYPVPAAPHP